MKTNAKRKNNNLISDGRINMQALLLNTTVFKAITDELRMLKQKILLAFFNASSFHSYTFLCDVSKAIPRSNFVLFSATSP